MPRIDLSGRTCLVGLHCRTVDNDHSDGSHTQLPTKKVVITRVISDPTNFRTFPILIRLIFIHHTPYFLHLTSHIALVLVEAVVTVVASAIIVTATGVGATACIGTAAGFGSRTCRRTASLTLRAAVAALALSALGSAGRRALGGCNLSLGLVGPRQLGVLLQLVASEIACASVWRP